MRIYPAFSRRTLAALISLVVPVFVTLGSVSAHARTITLSATEWPPFTSASIDGGGVMIEIAREALELRGYSVDVVIVPWKRALKGTKSGRYDALVGASYTEERAVHYVYPQRGFDNRSSLFTRKGAPGEYSTLSDLCPAKVGVLAGSYLADLLAKANCFEILPVAQTDAYIDMLKKGRFDMITESAAWVQYALSQQETDDRIEIIEVRPPLSSNQAFTVFSREIENAEQVARDFDRGVAELEQSGRLAEIMRRYNLEE